MANNQFMLNTDVWSTDFVDLTLEEQGMYMLICSQKTLNLCGVLAYSPRRLAMLSRLSTPRRAEKLVETLQAHRYIEVDKATDELIVRTFVKSSGILKQPNVVSGMTKQYIQIASATLRQIVLGQVIDANNNGTLKIKPEDFHPFFDKELREWFANSEGNPSANPSLNASRRVTPTTCLHDYLLLGTLPSQPGTSLSLVPESSHVASAPLAKEQDAAVLEVFNHWKNANNKTSTVVLNKKRDTLIRSVVKTYGIDDVKRAITNNANDAWARSVGKIELEFVLRSDQIETWRDKAGPKPGTSSAIDGDWTDGGDPTRLPSGEDIRLGRWVRRSGRFGA
jgi:hypothetical protein